MSISSEEDVAPKVSLSPSRLLFDEDDSSSEPSTTSGPRRRCSFVSSNSDRPNVMDIRSNYPDSVCGRSYDLSICSDDGNIMSSNTLNDLALEKVGMFEIALSAGLKKNAADNDILSWSESGHASTKTAATTGRLMTKLSQSFSSMKQGLELPTSGYAVSSTGEILGDDDYSAVKKIKATPQRKAYIRRCVQAAGLFALLSIIVGSFLLLEISDIDPSSIISSLAAKTSSILENLVTSSSGPGPAATEEETKSYQGPEELGEKRMMTQEEVPSVNEMIPPQDPPINTNHENDKMFIQAFRNHQKLSHRIDDDHMRQRMMMQGSQNHESNVFNPNEIDPGDTSSGLRRRLDKK